MLWHFSGGASKEIGRRAVRKKRKTRQGIESRERTTRSDEERITISHEAS